MLVIGICIISTFALKAQVNSASTKINVPEDFYFNIDLSNADYYNGRKELYFRQYEMDVKSIKLKLTLKEKTEVYKSIQEYDFASFPENYNGDENEIPMDGAGQKIFISVCEYGKLKTVTFDPYDTTELKKKNATPFLKLHAEISNLIATKSTVISLPNSDNLKE